MDLGGTLRRHNDYLRIIILDSTLDYDGSSFYADDEKDHQVDIPENQILVVDPDTGELKTIRR